MKKLAYEIPEFELALVEEDINTTTMWDSAEDSDTEAIFPDIDWDW
jgi:hypothetical protein